MVYNAAHIPFEWEEQEVLKAGGIKIAHNTWNEVQVDTAQQRSKRRNLP